MKLHELHKPSRRAQVRDMLMLRRKKARDAKPYNPPVPDGGSSKNTSDLPEPPNADIMISDLVPHSL